MLTKDELLSAVPEEIIGNPWVQNVIETLRGMGGEAVAWGIISANTGKIGDVTLDKDETAEFSPAHVVPLYTAPAAPANEALAKRLSEAADFIEWDGGSKYIDAAVIAMREAAAALGGGK